MKKLVPVFVLLLLGGTIVWFYDNSNIQTASVNSEGRTMAFDPELQEALDLMSGLQSLSLNSGSPAETEDEIIALGEKVLKIKSAFAFNDDRIEVLREDQTYFEGEVHSYLSTLFPLANNIDQAIEGLKQPAAFITAYSNYVATVPGLLATSLGVSVSDLPDASDSFWEDVFEITKDAREIRARLRGNDWLENFEEKLCITNDSDNDPYMAGVVQLIQFERNSAGVVSYQVREEKPDMCTAGTGYEQINQTYNVALQVVCEKNQIKETELQEVCPHGCEAGVCLPEPEAPVELSHFELYRRGDIVSSVVDGEDRYSFELVVVAMNTNNRVATSYNGNGLIIVTGDGDAQFPTQVDLDLPVGVGIFDITLSTLDDVNISYKDVSNRINGGELVTGLRVYADGDDLELIDKFAILQDVMDRINGGESAEDVVNSLSDYEFEVLQNALDGSLFADIDESDMEVSMEGDVGGGVGMDMRDAWGDFMSGPGGEELEDAVDERKRNEDPFDLCSNGVQDGSEEGVDCGGICATSCENDCESQGLTDDDGDGVCDEDTSEQCSDGILNGAEEGVDCGGDCKPCEVVHGCTTSFAVNYNPEATVSDGSCIYEGCTDENAWNYNPYATIEDGSCEYYIEYD